MNTMIDLEQLTIGQMKEMIMRDALARARVVERTRQWRLQNAEKKAEQNRRAYLRRKAAMKAEKEAAKQADATDE